MAVAATAMRPGMAFAGRYALVMLVANLAWEIAHLPLYTLWTEAAAGTIARSLAHCTLGDVVIAMLALAAGAAIVARIATRTGRFVSLPMTVTMLGVAYTVFSEWLNVVVLQNWQYGPSMPVLPPLGTGLSPFLQWIVLPPLGLALASRWSARTRR